jgi:hypothetical protein
MPIQSRNRTGTEVDHGVSGVDHGVSGSIMGLCRRIAAFVAA